MRFVDHPQQLFQKSRPSPVLNLVKRMDHDEDRKLFCMVTVSHPRVNEVLHVFGRGVNGVKFVRKVLAYD